MRYSYSIKRATQLLSIFNEQFATTVFFHKVIEAGYPHPSMLSMVQGVIDPSLLEEFLELVSELEDRLRGKGHNEKCDWAPREDAQLAR